MMYQGLCNPNYEHERRCWKDNIDTIPWHRPGRQGKKALLLDLDAQGGLSIAMGCSYPNLLPVTMVDIFQKVKDTQRNGNIVEGILSVSEYLDYLPTNR